MSRNSLLSRYGFQWSKSRSTNGALVIAIGLWIEPANATPV
jgi:hypothetical protein